MEFLCAAFGVAAQFVTRQEKLNENLFKKCK